MRRQRGQAADPALLAKIERDFAAFRRTRRGARQHWSEDLRRLACDAFDSGCALTKISAASGTSTSTVWKWVSERKNTSLPKLRQLRIVTTPQQAVATTQFGSDRALVRIGAQIVVEVPISSVTAEFIRSLAVPEVAAGVAL